MVRTTQTARASSNTGGGFSFGVPQVQRNDALTKDGTIELEGATNDADIILEEKLLLAKDRAEVLSSLSPSSPEFHYFHAIHLLHQLDVDEPPVEATVQAILNHASVLESNSGWWRARRIRLRLHVLLLQKGRQEGREFFVDALSLNLTSKPPDADSTTTADDISASDTKKSSTLSFDIETIKLEKVAKLKTMFFHQGDDLQLSQEGRGITRDMSAFTRQEFFQQLATSNALPDWSDAQKQSALKYMLDDRTLEWTDFPEFIDVMAKGIVDASKRADAESSKFGTQPYHDTLTKDQLDALWDRCSDLLQHSIFFATQYLLHVRTGSSDDKSFFPLAIQSLKRFGSRMNGLRLVILHQWLQTIQYNHDDPHMGGLFLDYIAIPREGSYIVNNEWVRNAEYDDVVVFNSNAFHFSRGDHSKPKPTVSELADGLGYIVDSQSDQVLIQDVLNTLFLGGSTIQDFAPYLSPEFLKTGYAVAMLTSGRGTRAEFERDVTDSVGFKQIFDSSEVAFCKSNPATYAPDDRVSLVLNVKNVKALTIQLFEINVSDHYRRKFSEIASDISLEGLHPNEELQVRFDDVPSHVQKQHRIEFEALQGFRRGVFIVEVVGENSACRAVLRKGFLRFTQEITAHGHELTVIDEANHVLHDCVAVVPDTKVKSKQQSFASSSNGKIVVPFKSMVDDSGTAPVESPIFIGHGTFGILGVFKYAGESYSLKANMFIDSEQLRPGHKATAIIRTALFLQGCPVSTALLANTILSIVFTSETNVQTKREIKNLPAPNDANDIVVTIAIPNEAASIQMTLNGEVHSVHSLPINGWPRKNYQVSDSESFDIPRPTGDDVLFNPHLKRIPNSSGNGDEFVILVLGHNGEPVPRVNATIQLHHFAFKSHFTYDLVSDDLGAIHVGPLEHIKSIRATIKKRQSIWQLPSWKSHSLAVKALAYAQVIQCALPDATVHLPLPESIQHNLFGWITVNAISVLKIEELKYTRIKRSCENNGVLEVGPGSSLIFKPSQPGSYEIVVKPIELAYVVNVAKSNVAGFAIENQSLVKNDNTSPILLNTVTVEGYQLKIRAINTTPLTRAHVILKRFIGTKSVIDVLNQGTDVDSTTRAFEAKHPQNEYFGSKRIGDEYAYILGRRAFEHQHPGSTLMQGNMLPNPTLLLNPFKAKDTTSSSLAVTKEGEAYGKSRPGFGSAERAACFSRLSAPVHKSLKIGPPRSFQSNTHFLETASIVVSNRHFDENGELVLPLPEGLVGTYDVIVSTCNGSSVAVGYKNVLFGSPTPLWAAPLTNTSLARDAAFGLTEEAHAIQVRGHRCVVTPDIVEMPCGGTSKVEVYDSFEHAFGLLDTLTKHSVLYNDYLKQWPTLSRSTKEAIYSEDASNELNVFLYKKDRTFFDAVVLPHIRVKFAKDFIDWYLINDTRALQSYFTNAKKFDGLTLVEKLLLAERMSRENATAICNHVIRLIETYYDESTSCKLDAVFDHVMTSKSVEQSDTPEETEDLLQSGQTPTGTEIGGFTFGATSAFGASSGGFGVTNYSQQLPPPPGSAFGQPRSMFAAPSTGFVEFGSVPQAPRQDMFEGGNDDDWEEVNASEQSESESDNDVDETVAQTKKKRRNAIYKAPGKTKMLKERRFYNGKDETQQLHGGLVPLTVAVQSKAWVGSAISKFWLAYARHLLQQDTSPFLSAHFPETASSFAEIMFALSVLDLPFSGSEWETKSTRPSTLSIQAKQPVIVYFEDIRPESQTQTLSDATAMAGSNLIVTQTIFNPADSDIQQGQLKPVNEFVRQKIYGCQVTVSNLSPRATPVLSLLVQIPEGAIPVSTGGFYTRNSSFSLGGNETETVLLNFYFPSEGTFSHFPAHVAIDGQTVRWSDASPMSPRSISVVAASKVVDITSWKDVTARGSADTVMTFLHKHRKLDTIDWVHVTWRLKDKSLYETLTAFMRQHFLYSDDVWQYAFHHQDNVGMAELLQRRQSAYEVGPGLKSPFVLPIDLYDTVGDCVQACLEHAEFTPFILQRTHSMKGNEVIPNNDLRDYYRILCHSLCLLPSLQDHHYLVLVYFMVVLNRLDTALDLFRNIRDPVAYQMQYDYMNGFLDFYRNDAAFPIARAVAQSYKSYPEQRWRTLFGHLQEQLDELDKLVPTGEGATASSSVQDVSLEMTVGKGSFVLTQRGNRITRCVVKYYPVDVEVMFSREPFSGQDAKVSSCISLINPRATHAIQLSTTDATTAVEMPTALQSTQMLVVVSPEDFPELEVVKPHFCDTMDVSFGLDEGLVQVFASHRPLARTYVKVFVQTKASKKPTFYKDGYTDICGRFDYMAINDTALLLDVTKVALLLLHPQHGAVIRQISPPVTISTEADQPPTKTNWNRRPPEVYQV
ncbi:Aste57867_23119 [Aphanomyces stellatus]|uniref:Aste57867_23119 protein n=2 Tax=Aphanomyces stellatus TaxID=120398 RepID=A0A485LNJ4_9STRA|nr:hypothetical protein As57867_023048 [Aphanomyces stellatus]VFT99767.1 Aste57867_23119 [Aphanomyces stellatus]